MIRKSIVLSSLALMITVGAFAQDKKAAPQAAPAQTTAPADMKNAPEMTFEVEEYNFGTCKQGESVTREFAFTNTGKEALIISNAQGSCGCTVPQYPKEPIAPKGKGVIKVTFNSAGKQGMQDKTVTLTSNAKNSPKVLHIRGTVEMPAATAEPAKDAPKN
jgi:hypothetical protein